MNELTAQPMQLPEALEDLSKFVLVGREKLVFVRAEIKAIDKLHLAEEVRNQKKSEAQMLSEALLDAEVRLGELLKRIPKNLGGRPEKTMDSGVASFKEVSKRNGEACLIKPKCEVVHELGFTQKQAQRFETLADNQDIVEQVKQEARENDDIPIWKKLIQKALWK